jgi:peptidoglycan hydrolase-like protein with peptidoglycan-binding domain
MGVFSDIGVAHQGAVRVMKGSKHVARRRSIGVTVAATVTALAVAGGVAYGVGQLTAGSDPSPDIAVSASTSAPHTTSMPTPEVTPTETPTATETPTPTPTSTARFALGDSGDGVRDLQARLKQIQWYEPEITGDFDDVTMQAVEGFQAKRELEVTGEVDDQTWDRLVAMTREPTDDEMHNRVVAGPTIIGPNESGDRVRELQARLRQIGWFEQDVTGTYGPVTSTAVAGFQTKRGIPSTGEVDQRTWDLLASMTRKPTDDEMHNRRPESSGDASGLPSQCATGRVLCIDKTSRSLRWVIDGAVKMTLDARFGSELTPTREGTFSVYWKSRDHHSSLYDTPMPYAMFFDGGQAVHYSPDFAANGYNGSSHGCVNIRDQGAIASLFDQVRTGDRVFVYRS